MDKSWRNLKVLVMPDTCILCYPSSVFTIHLICLEVSGKGCNFAFEMSNIRTYEITHSEQKPLPIKQKDSTEYLLGGSLVMKNGKIDKVLFEGGYAQATAANSTTDKFAFNFYNQDHLGNNREVVDAKGVVQQVTNYYPFGAPYADASAIMGAAVQPYKYNGKELDLMHGLNTYDYGARQHDPILARWDRIDPLCEKYYSTSPYAYCVNNPVILVDPDGEDVHLSISNVASNETGQIRVYSAAGTANPCVKANVPLYQLTVTDDVTNETSYYQVTRDALVTSDGGKTFTNYAFEPQKTTEYDGKITPNNYPDKTDLNAVCLSNKGNNEIAADSHRPVQPGGKKGSAYGIMIHVGGEYIKDGKECFAGSLGCICVAGGAEEMKRLIGDIMNRQGMEGNENIKITIEKREDVIWQGNCNIWPTEPFR